MVSEKHALNICESLAERLAEATDNELTYMVFEQYGELRLLIAVDGVRHYTYKPGVVRDWLDKPPTGTKEEELGAFSWLAEPFGPITFKGIP